MGLNEKILIFTSLLNYLSSEKVYIFDVFKRKGLTEDWNKDNSQCDGVSSWYFDENDQASPRFQVCFTRNCFLESPSYPITSINTVYADAKFTGRYCNALPKPNPDCGENITVNAIMLDTFPNTKTHNTPTEKEINFPVMDDLKVPIPQKNGRPPSFFDAKETITYDNKLNKTFIRLLFDSKMGCGGVSDLEVYYYKCPSTTSSLAVFGDINAPTYSENVKEYQGKCVDNAFQVVDEPLTMKCLWNGTIASTTGQCICLQGYEKEGNECKKIPDISSAIVFLNITSSSVEITWSHLSQVNKTNIYIVDCNDCPSGVLPKSTTNKFITINGLGSFADYEISVTFSSEVSRMIGENQTSEFQSFQTLPGVPGKVRNLMQKSLDNGKVELSWDPPFAKGNNIITYLLTYGGSTKKTTLTTHILDPDVEEQTFSVEIAAQVSVGGQLLTGESSTFKEKIHVKGGAALDMAIGVGVGVVLLVIIIGIVAFYIYRKKNLKAINDDDGGKVEMKETSTYGKVLENPFENDENSGPEINPNSLTIVQMLSNGKSLDISKGALLKNGEMKTVVIKTLKETATESDRIDFLQEASLVGKMNHTNIIKYEGIILKSQPHTIALEYMLNGTLNLYLKKHDMKLTNLQLLGMARGVASGMKYLNELGFIHRDIAARNVVLADNGECKISNFGMCRELDGKGCFMAKDGKIAIIWAAPESAHQKIFTTASDVWSYGILLWEIMSYGERPYWNMESPADVLEAIDQGYRLPPLKNCPRVAYDMMLECWEIEHTKRPTINEILNRIDKWIDNPEELLDEATPDGYSSLYSNHSNKNGADYAEISDYADLKSVNDWLRQENRRVFFYNLMYTRRV
uniref:receptor protein-tyrosine kinase n=1 Tax=Clytia hemisphaerica TaxID=252671 RepID=A0A7M5US18_9CNID